MVAALGHWPEAVRYRTHFFHPNSLLLTDCCRNTTWVADPHHLDVDADPSFHFDADPVPTFHFDADLVPTFHFDADLDPDPASHQS
jgi:hypothetical protein